MPTAVRGPELQRQSLPRERPAVGLGYWLLTQLSRRHRDRPPAGHNREHPPSSQTSRDSPPRLRFKLCFPPQVLLLLF